MKKILIISICLLLSMPLFAGLKGACGVNISPFAHFVGSADSLTYTPDLGGASTFIKLTPGMIAHETDYITYAADSITIDAGYDGDYLIDISIRLSGANVNDVWQIKVYKNGLAMLSDVGRFIFRTTASGQADTRSFFWYLIDLVEGDDISFYIANLTADRDPTIMDMKIFISRMAE